MSLLQIKAPRLEGRKQGLNFPPLPVEFEHRIGIDSARGQNEKRAIFQTLEPNSYLDGLSSTGYLVASQKIRLLKPARPSKHPGREGPFSGREGPFF